MSPQRFALIVFFVSVAVNAVLGITALFIGDSGDVQGKILLTSLSVSAASVLSLATFPARERGLLGPVPVTGIALSVIGFSLLIIFVWADFRGDSLTKIVGSVMAFAFSAVYASLIALAVVRPAYARVVTAAYALALALALLVVLAIWSNADDAALGRVVGVVAILLAAATVSIPVLHRISRRAVAGVFITSGTGRSPDRCVCCGSTDIGSVDGVTYTCSACQTRFRAEILI